MGKGKELFAMQTPLGITVRTTEEYWQYLITAKHPIMNGKEAIVRAVLTNPAEVRQSRSDNEVFLYYGQFDKQYCVVVKQQGITGFMVTAYPVDKIKEGDVVWKK